ncbi:MAG: LysR family transcriptional regulator [Sphingomonadaceae bacterium]
MTDTQRLPSLRGIEAFVAVAEALSFRDAAERLNLTASAVSRRVQALEQQFGVALFERGPRSVSLTIAGNAYLERLRPGLEIVREASAAASRSRREAPIRVATTPLISTQWLHGALGNFLENRPGCEVEIHTVPSLRVELEAGIDMCISSLKDGDMVSDAVRLFGMEFFPICAPELVQSLALRKPEDLMQATLLVAGGARDAWPMWLRAAGLAELTPRGGIMIADSASYLEAVGQGLGVGLGSAGLSEAILSSGRAVRLFDVICRYPRSVYARANQLSLKRPEVKSLFEWLLSRGRAIGS